MKALICTRCGASKWQEDGMYRVCVHCGTQFLINEPERAFSTASKPQKTPPVHENEGIALDDDVERLLQKCRTDRRNARKYANLVLDIDPMNQEALKYL